MVNLTHSCPEGAALRARLLELWERTGSASLGCLAHNGSPRAGHVVANEQEYTDWVSTCLMDTFKDTSDPSVFALLFELNRGSFLHAIQGSLRRVYHHVDALDVLQEVFLNIYRYPHRFHADRADAFRGWGHRIARNTLLKFLKGQARLSRFHEIDDETLEPEDVRGRPPDLVASDAESALVVNHAYLIYLQLYLLHFGRLSEKEQRALKMVEVEGVSYRDAAGVLGIRLENLKMVIFRGRRKIFRGMEQSVAGFAAPPHDAPEDARVHASRGVAPRRFAGEAGAGRRIFERSARSRESTRDPGAPDA